MDEGWWCRLEDRQRQSGVHDDRDSELPFELLPEHLEAPSVVAAAVDPQLPLAAHTLGVILDEEQYADLGGYANGRLVTAGEAADGRSLDEVPDPDVCAGASLEPVDLVRRLLVLDVGADPEIGGEYDIGRTCERLLKTELRR